jgi:hypothetical protein
MTLIESSNVITSRTTLSKLADFDYESAVGLDSAELRMDKQTPQQQQHLSADRQPEPAGADVPEPEREEGHSTSERPGDQTS